MEEVCKLQSDDKWMLNFIFKLKPGVFFTCSFHALLTDFATLSEFSLTLNLTICEINSNGIG
jgi:hypothetical protein